MAKHLVTAGHLNLAICYLKLGRHRQARDACNSCLQLEPNSVKALYRRGLVSEAAVNAEVERLLPQQNNYLQLLSFCLLKAVACCRG